MRTTHSTPVSCAAASPDGLLLASGSYDRRILLWDAVSGAGAGELAGHTSLVNGLDWSPDGRALASASSDHTARVWSLETRCPVALLRGHTDDVNAVRWSPDGLRLASASFDGSVRVWSATGACLLVAAHHRGDVNGVAWLPDGQRLAAASDDGTVSVFDAADGRPRRILAGHGDWVDQVVAHPDGVHLASASQDGTARVWDWVRGCTVAVLDRSSCAVKDVAWTPDGGALAASSYDGAVRVYEHGSFRLLAELRAEGLWNRTLAGTPQGWLTGSFGGGPVLLSERGVRRFGATQTKGLNAVAVLPDGRTALAGSDDGALYRVDLVGRRPLGALGRHRAAVLCVAVSRDGRYAASGSWDRTVRVWDLAAGHCVAQWPGSGDPVNALAFDPRGELVWIGTFNGDVVGWRWASGEALVAHAHKGSVKGLACGEGLVWSCGRDGHVRRWTPGGVTSFAAGPSILNGVALAPTDRRIATVSRRAGLEVWSPEGAPLAAFRGHACSAKAVAWSPDSRRLAAVYYDGHMALYCPHTRMARVEQLCDASLSQVAFAGQRAVVSAWDRAGTLFVVDEDGGCHAIEAAA